MSSKSEEWKDITGYEGLYQVSTLGNVRSYDKIVGCRGGKTRLVKGKILAPTRSGNGYVKVMLTKNKTRRNRNVHRLISCRSIYTKPRRIYRYKSYKRN